jgi:hypothetical protein
MWVHSLALYGAMVVETEQAYRLREASVALAAAEADCAAFAQAFGHDIETRLR